VGSQVVTRAFVQAYRQAASNSAASAAREAAGKTAGSVGGSNMLTKQTGIDMDEACKILNMKKDSLLMEEIQSVSFPAGRG
jgi:mitochondrial import inner membrane translocase subunit TIM16